MVTDASLLSVQHIRTGLASLSSQTLLKKMKLFPSGMGSQVFNMSCDNLLRNQPKIN